MASERIEINNLTSNNISKESTDQVNNQSAFQEKSELRKTKRSQSFQSYIKQDNEKNLNPRKPWCVVKVIDLGHVFPADDDELDFNYIHGIDNLVEIFEKLLSSST